MQRAHVLPAVPPEKPNGQFNGNGDGNGNGHSHTHGNGNGSGKSNRNGNGNGNGNDSGNGHSRPVTIGETVIIADTQSVEVAEPLPAQQHSADQQLVDRCRAGDGQAWAEIHTKCHGHLVRQIRFTLGDRGRDSNLVEEIAARVWYTLFADEGYLLGRFEPIKGSGLEKYLAAVARFEVMRHQRSEFRRRRRERETHALRQTTRNERDFVDMELDVAEFLPNLTRRERQYFDSVLLGGDGEEMEVSAPNAWQLRHRIRKKLLSFLDLE